MTGGWRSGRERKCHVCPAGADAAVARARGAGSQPRVPPSATHAAAPPAACRNLLRVNLELKSAPHSRCCTGYFFAHLPEVTQGTLLHPTPTTASRSEALAAAWGPWITILRRGSRACLVRRCSCGALCLRDADGPWRSTVPALWPPLPRYLPGRRYGRAACR